MASELQRIETLDAFRERKRHGRGVIAIRGTTGTTLHDPDCPFVTEEGFLEKQENPKGGYFWLPEVAAADAQWPGAQVCGHPSDPLNGGPGGDEARWGAFPDKALPETAEGPGWEVRGPALQLRTVRGSADWTLPFEPKRPEQLEFRSELRRRLRRLVTREDEALQATFFGAKPARADVENLLLYNVDESGGCFVGGQQRIRFELGPPGMELARPAGYVYRPVPIDAGFAAWNEERTIARWEAVDLATAPTTVAPLWLALRTTPVELGEAYTGDFGIRVELSHPAEARASAVKLVKPLFDAVVVALQAQRDAEAAAEVSQILAEALDRSLAETAQLLLTTDRAVLGVAESIVHARGTGVQWAPCDDRCIAGEVRLRESAEATWRLDVDVVALTPRAR